MLDTNVFDDYDQVEYFDSYRCDSDEEDIDEDEELFDDYEEDEILEEDWDIQDPFEDDLEAAGDYQDDWRY